MIKLTWGQIRDPQFNPILQKLLKAKMPFASAKRLLEIIKQIQAEQKKSDEMWLTLKDRYLEVVPESEEKMLRIKETLSEDEKNSALQEFEEFGNAKVEIMLEPLSADELALVELAPIDVARIEGMVAAE